MLCSCAWVCQGSEDPSILRSLPQQSSPSPPAVITEAMKQDLVLEALKWCGVDSDYVDEVLGEAEATEGAAAAAVAALAGDPIPEATLEAVAAVAGVPLDAEAKQLMKLKKRHREMQKLSVQQTLGEVLQDSQLQKLQKLPQLQADIKALEPAWEPVDLTMAEQEALKATITERKQKIADQRNRELCWQLEKQASDMIDSHGIQAQEQNQHNESEGDSEADGAETQGGSTEGKAGGAVGENAEEVSS